MLWTSCCTSAERGNDKDKVQVEVGTSGTSSIASSRRQSKEKEKPVNQGQSIGIGFGAKPLPALDASVLAASPPLPVAAAAAAPMAQAVIQPSAGGSVSAAQAAGPAAIVTKSLSRESTGNSRQEKSGKPPKDPSNYYSNESASSSVYDKDDLMPFTVKNPPLRKGSKQRQGSKGSDPQRDAEQPVFARRKSIEHMEQFLHSSSPNMRSRLNSLGSANSGGKSKKASQNREKVVGKDNVEKGLAVVRGPDWKWGGDDGGPGQVGTILAIDKKTGTVTVMWHNTETVNAYYRYGKSSDLAVAPTTATQMVTKLPSRAGARRNSQGDFAKPAQTVIIFDWDDTLFPTTFIRDDLELKWQRPLKEQSLTAKAKAEVAENLNKCALNVSELMRLSCAYGKVILVTLAKQPWVEESCKNFFPTIGSLIEELQVPVVYAQDGMNQVDYNKVAMGSTEDIQKYWSEIKGKAIANEVKQFYTQYEGQSWKNIISIGDSDFERLGTQAATKDYMERNGLSEGTEELEVDGHLLKVRTKTFKLVDQPTIEELTVEVSMLTKWLPLMVSLDRGFDVNLNEVDDPQALQRIEKVLSGQP